MSRYAKVTDEKVVDIIMADEKFFETFVDTSAGTWVKVEDNQNACIGGFYDFEKKLFSPRPMFESWTWNKETNEFDPPTPMPTDKLENNNYYEWNEQNQKWNLVERKID